MRYIAAVGLAVGASFGLLGSFLDSGPAQNGAWEISSVGLIVGAVLLTFRLARAGQDEAAAGFAILAVAEGVMSAGTAASPSGLIAAFGAGVALYVPALILIGAPRVFPIWSRAAAVLAAAPFLAEAVLVFDNHPQPPTGPLPSAGYALMTVAIVGWIIYALQAAPTPAPPAS